MTVIVRKRYMYSYKNEENILKDNMLAKKFESETIHINSQN